MFLPSVYCFISCIKIEAADCNAGFRDSIVFSNVFRIKSTGTAENASLSVQTQPNHGDWRPFTIPQEASRFTGCRWGIGMLFFAGAKAGCNGISDRLLGGSGGLAFPTARFFRSRGGFFVGLSGSGGFFTLLALASRFRDCDGCLFGEGTANHAEDRWQWDQ